jgi:predicted nucleotidyltransferase
LFRAIADQIDGWSIQPEKVSVFGSAARLDADADSDVDILVVRAKGIEPDNSDWNGQVSDLSASVFDWTGNRASIVEIPYSTLHEWTGLNTPRIAQEIGKDEIPLVGPRMSSLLSG